MIIKEQVQGSILGAACGDALGMPTEGLSYQQIQDAYGGWVNCYKKPIHRSKKPGQWTDDTDQILLLTETLIEAKGFDVHHYRHKLVEFARKFLDGKIPNRGYGRTSRTAFRNLVNNIIPSGGNSPSCGAAMKIGPLGLFYADESLEKICEYVQLCAQITHLHPESISGACAITVAVATATKPNSTIPEILKAGIRAAAQIEDGIAPHLKVVLKKVQNSNQPLFRILKTGFSAKRTVGICFAIISRYPTYKDAIEHAINLGGDTDSYGTMIGSILGAKYGISCIPELWLNGLEAKPYIHSLATKLYETILKVKNHYNH
ncbi:MAG: ADP-ribosylglycohydrolase family protein [Candidatus Helarchaeota archaeon]